MIIFNLSSYFLKKKYCIPIDIMLFIRLDSYNPEWSEVQEHTDHKAGGILSIVEEALYHLLMSINS